MKYKLAVFDLDGTLLDSLEDLRDSVNVVLEAHNYPKRSLEEIRHFVGNGSVKLIERAVPTGTSKEEEKIIHDEYKEYYDKHCNEKTKAYEGIIDVLKILKNNGVKLAILSNKPNFTVEKLNEIYFEGLFEIARGSLPEVAVKPAPDSLLRILKELNISREDTVYIGDSDVDVNTAKNAGVDEIAVTWGFRDENFLKEKGATRFAKNSKELLELISRLS